MKRILLILLTFAGTFNFAGALTLTEALAEAAEKSPQIMIQEESVKMASLDNAAAITSFLPKVTGSFTYVKLDTVPTTQTMTAMGLQTIQVGTDNNYSTIVQLNQPIFLGGRLINAYLISADKKKIAEYDLMQSRTDIKMAVIQLYLAGLLTGKMTDMYETVLQSSKEHFLTAEKRYQLGSISRLEYLASKTQYESNKPKLEASQNSLKNIKNSIKLLLGRSMDTDFEFEGALDSNIINMFEYSIPLDFKDSLTETAKKNRVDMKSMKVTLSMLKKLEGMNYMAFLPSIVGFAQYKYANSYSIYGDSTYFDGSSNIGVSAQMDIFTSGKRVMDILKAKHQYKQVNMSYALLKSRLESDIENLLNAYNSSSSSVLSMDAALATAEEAYKTAKEQFSNGIITNSDYLDAESNYISAQAGYTKSMYDMVISYFSLINALGIL